MGVFKIGALAVVLILATVTRLALSEFVEYYELLGVPRDVSTAELKKTFRKRSVELHPDKNKAADAVEQFHNLQNAYDCLSDPASREYYDIYEESWAEMKEYKEKHLKTMRMQMYQRNGRMYRQNREVELEEMFWGDNNVQMLHQSFAAKLLGNFPGVWVLFFGNPNCGPCKRTAPTISGFAKWARPVRDWLRVGTVNMGINGNGNLLDHFGDAASSIPQIILVAPALSVELGLEARVADFEIFDRGDDKGRAFALRLLKACENLLDSAVPELDFIPGEDLAVSVAAGQRAAEGVDADPNAKWAVLVVDGSNAAAKYAPVFRRLAHRTRHAGFVFRVLRCGGEEEAPAASDGFCDGVGSFPELRVYGSRNAAAGGVPERLLATSPGELLDAATGDARRYGYGQEQAGFGVFAEAVLRTSSPGEERFPGIVTVSGAVHQAHLDGPLVRIGMQHGRPLYKRKNVSVFLRWLLPSQRSNRKGAWIISDMVEPVDRGWAFLEQDLLVPIDERNWQLLENDKFNPYPGMSVSNGEDWALDEASNSSPSAAGARAEL